jgi:hypothetical protein
VKVVVVDQNGGPNIDHLRIGKPPAVVMKSEFCFVVVSYFLSGFHSSFGFSLHSSCSFLCSATIVLTFSANGWPRVIAKNGIQLLDNWPFTFSNTTMVYFPDYPEPPQGDVLRYRIGRVRVMLPDGRQRYLDIGNVSFVLV